ncbi:MAG: RdgB/HAM1 family non-canonical purine NTP pyrophosphatase [Candidatus Marinimicrobia bacterium]|nr:RdgB/HAM1 family non-canonical purine NTP pyrophosphatase [Candidatus Neomarinimicrobiota bacterium]
MKWVVATHNRDKLQEILPLFDGFAVQLLGLETFPEIGPIEETGTTLEENALIKARLVHSVTGLPTIADDTGLEVAALGGDPGVRSARFSGLNATYADNVALLLERLGDCPPEERAARFRTVAAFVDGSVEIVTDGVAPGSITGSPHGDRGFGYDSIFRPEGHKDTFGQMSRADKQLISHRARAFGALVERLTTTLSSFHKKEASTQTH